MLLLKRSTIGLVVLQTLLLVSVAIAQEPPGVSTYTGSFADGATYLIQVPDNWNGTFVLYSHGYVAAGSQNPAYDVGDGYTGYYLLASGYALGGSSYANTGWAIHEALRDQISVLDTFQALVGTPRRTIAWGHSLGGIVTAGLVQQNPGRFQGALPMCGVTGGAVGFWNQFLDLSYAFDTLLAGGSNLQLVNITDPTSNLSLADNIVYYAQTTAQGQARIALIASLADEPGWFSDLLPPPAPGDYAAQEVNQYDWVGGGAFPMTFFYRAELESRAGGNPSFNTGVDYARQFNLSINVAEVTALYQQAHLDLNADLARLNAGARISSNPSSLTYAEQNIDLYRAPAVPVLTLHGEADGLVAVENESAYKNAGGVVNDPLLRQIFVHRAGHCSFTSGETLAAFEALVNRLDTGQWSGLDPQDLDDAANQLAPYQNILFAPAFTQFQPAPYLRPYYVYP